MKKVLNAVVLGALILAIPVSVSGFAFVETIEDNGIGSSGYDYVSTVEFSDGFVGWLDAGYWSHSLNPAYGSGGNGYYLNSAVLEISGWQYSGFGGEIVAVAGTVQWTGFHGWQVLNYNTSVLDLTNTNSEYWNYSSLDVAMVPVFETGVNLTHSTLYLDYAQGTDGDEALATPEPGTILLMSLGLAGGGLYRRFRKRS